MAVAKVDGILAAISCLCICVHTYVSARVHVHVCLSVVSISSKVSDWRLNLDIFQVLICLLALLGILMDICKLRHAIYHSLEEQWGKLELQFTDQGRFVMVQL